MSADGKTADGEPLDGATLGFAKPDTDALASPVEQLPPGHQAVDRQTTAGPLLRPPPPLAKRLNRNALTVAAALAGVTVLTVVVVTNPSRSTAAGGSRATASADAAPPVPARPAFLDQPVKAAPTPRAGVLAGAVDGQSPHPATSAGAVPCGVGRGHASAATDAALGLPVPPFESTSINPAITTVNGVATVGSIRGQAYRAALTSGVLVGISAHRSPSSASSIVDQHEPGVFGQPDPMRSAPAFSDEAAPMSGPMARPVSNTSASVSGGSAGPVGVETPSAVGAAGSPYTLRAGTVIAGLLVTGVNSDLPGEVLGQTSRDLYDSRTQQQLLVPSGSRLIGSYDNRSVGTGRLVVMWSRLIFPDGRSMSLPHLAGTDGQGQAGLHDQIDHHYDRVYGAALLTSVLTAGVQLSQPQQSGLYGVPNSRQVAAGALGQTMGDVAIENARRGLDVLPTITIRPGQPFNVLLAEDLVFDAPYVPGSVVISP